MSRLEFIFNTRLTTDTHHKTDLVCRLSSCPENVLFYHPCLFVFHLSHYCIYVLCMYTQPVTNNRRGDPSVQGLSPMTCQLSLCLQKRSVVLLFYGTDFDEHSSDFFPYNRKPTNRNFPFVLYFVPNVNSLSTRHQSQLIQARFYFIYFPSVCFFSHFFS